MIIWPVIGEQTKKLILNFYERKCSEMGRRHQESTCLAYRTHTHEAQNQGSEMNPMSASDSRLSCLPDSLVCSILSWIDGASIARLEVRREPAIPHPFRRPPMTRRRHAVRPRATAASVRAAARASPRHCSLSAVWCVPFAWARRRRGSSGCRWVTASFVPDGIRAHRRPSNGARGGRVSRFATTAAPPRSPRTR